MAIWECVALLTSVLQGTETLLNKMPLVLKFSVETPQSENGDAADGEGEGKGEGENDGKQEGIDIKKAIREALEAIYSKHHH